MQKVDILHPIISQEKLIRERKVIVLNNVNTMPLYGQPYVSPHLVIGLCHQGFARVDYDMQPKEFHPRQISIIYPNHLLTTHETSPDYNATLIVVAPELLSELQHRSSYRYQLEYQRRPAFQLDSEQYDTVCHAMSVIEHVSHMETPNRLNLIAGLLDMFSQLLDEYRFSDQSKLPEWTAGEKLFYRFSDAIIHHHRESHEVKFYANLLCLSPKYFALLIKQETGTSASDWIANYLITQAKSLLINRRDLNIQQISHRLGFPEQSAFSRYFRKQTGITPVAYRLQVSS